MRENCTSGSVRGEGGNILTYSACGFVDLIAIEMMKACVGICLERSAEGLEVLSRMLSLAIGRVSEPDCRSGRIPSGSVIANISPQSASPGLAVVG